MMRDKALESKRSEKTLPNRSRSSTKARDSDSGLERTSSSASSSSADELRPTIGEEDQECFVDATEEFATTYEDTTNCQDQQPSNENELKCRLAEVGKVLRLALNNEFISALNICGPKADRELYASLANAVLTFLKAALTLEQADLQAALKAINLSFEVSSRQRRKTSTASMVMRFIYKPNYNSYSDSEIHAELVHAESLLLLALISFLADQSIICLVKGAFRIRACYQRYKECLIMMETSREWSSEEAKCHFESGVRMGYGIFNLLMSYLPRRVLRFLEYVGFSGNRSLGVEELERSIALDDGLRSVFSCLVILAYHTYIENLFGLGAYDAEKVEQINNRLSVDYPKSAFYLLFKGRQLQMAGKLDEAISTFQDCIEAQDDWRQFHSICHWEMMWCYAVQMNWPKAAHYSDLMRKHSKWSAASYTYQYATFLYAQLVEDQRRGLCSEGSLEYVKRMEEIETIMQQVPTLRIRYAGKTIPAEKFAITRAAKFSRQRNRLTLPALEFLYIWNIFATLKNSPQQVLKLLGRINSEIEHIIKIKSSLESSSSSSASSANPDDDESSSASREDDEEEEECIQNDNWDDDLSLALLLKGMCLKHLDRIDEAEQAFMEVIGNESSIKVDTFLVPHTAMELAVLKLDMKEYDQAKQWTRLVRNDYTGYLLETIVHFRLHAASRAIRLEQQEENLNSSSASDQSDSMPRAPAKLDIKSVI